MKKTLLLIFGILVALPSFCQLDTVLALRDPDFHNLNLRLRKAVSQTVKMGMATVYVPETDVQGGNALNSLAKILVYQLPLSAQVSQGKLDSITTYIKQLTEPITIPDPQPLVRIKVDGSPKILTNKYTGTWNHVDSTASNPSWTSPFYKRTVSYSNALNATLTYEFVGKKIEWWTEKRVNHGIAEVKINGVVQAPVDLYDPTTANNCQVVVVYDAVATNNKIEIRVTGTKNAAATETTLIHDHFVVIK